MATYTGPHQLEKHFWTGDVDADGRLARVIAAMLINKIKALQVACGRHSLSRILLDPGFLLGFGRPLLLEEHLLHRHLLILLLLFFLQPPQLLSQLLLA